MSLGPFFAATAELFRGAARPDEAARRLRERFPGWEPPLPRVEHLAGAVFGRIRGLLGALYPVTREALAPSTWEALVERYYALRPAAVGYEINAAGAAFPGVLEPLVAELGLPPFLPALARLEWTRYAVFASAAEVPARVDRLSLNPTAEALEHAWRLAEYVERAAPRGAPSPGEEVVLVWRRADSARARHAAADARALLAVKLAVEGLDPVEVARAAGVPREQVLAAIAEQVAAGLLLAPAPPPLDG
ncbi:MAG: DUF2063 domain-containing protein [Planctomycetes bacterium]|nr:DUF2063 domain-containing protein [Planctomycetota bacterium]